MSLIGFRKGYVIEFGCFSPVSGYRLGYCTQVILGSIVLLSCIVFLMIRSSTQVIRRNLHIVCFVVLFNLIYALSFNAYVGQRSEDAAIATNSVFLDLGIDHAIAIN